MRQLIQRLWWNPPRPTYSRYRRGISSYQKTVIGTQKSNIPDRQAYERSEPIAETWGIRCQDRLPFGDYFDENKSEDGMVRLPPDWAYPWIQYRWILTNTLDQLVNDIKELKAKIATVEVTPISCWWSCRFAQKWQRKRLWWRRSLLHTDLYDFVSILRGWKDLLSLFFFLKPLIEKKRC